MHKDSGIRFDMAQFYPMKAVLERTLGRATFEKLKDAGTLADWKKALIRLLDAIKLSVDATVTVVDPDWRTEIIQILNDGRSALPKHKHIDELFTSFSATLVELVFLQLGHIPSNATLVSNSSTREAPIKLQRTVPLKPEYWTLRRFRSVQYVQTHQQHDNLKEYLGKQDKSRRRVKE
jgi:hypothetical protein